MHETLLFLSSVGILTTVEKIQVAFPGTKVTVLLCDTSDNFEVTLDLGPIDACTWCDWAIRNGIFSCCSTLVTLSFDPPEWMVPLLHASHLKEAARELDGN
jgi:hypothetical protein